MTVHNIEVTNSWRLFNIAEPLVSLLRRENAVHNEHVNCMTCSNNNFFFLLFLTKLNLYQHGQPIYIYKKCIYTLLWPPNRYLIILCTIQWTRKWPISWLDRDWIELEVTILCVALDSRWLHLSGQLFAIDFLRPTPQLSLSPLCISAPATQTQLPCVSHQVEQAQAKVVRLYETDSFRWMYYKQEIVP